MPPRKVIIDVDAGTDDAWALLLLVNNERRHNLKVEAITCVHGNAGVDDVAINVLRILTAIGRTDIPLYKGAREPLITPVPPRAEFFHGVNGFGDIEFGQTIDRTLLERQHAVLELYRRLADDPGNVSLIFVGPLTNLALCVRLFPDVRTLPKDLYVMGGNRHGIGNTTRAAEFNFYADPEAAHIVFNNMDCPITVLPWETCIVQAKALPFDWRMDVLGRTANEAVRMLNEVERKCYRTWTTWMPCDAFLVAVFVKPDIVVHEEHYHVDIELAGRLTRGQMVLDHLKTNSVNTRIIDRIHDEQFRALCLSSAGSDNTTE